METWKEKIEEIKHQFKEVIKYSQDFENEDLKVDKLFEKWQEAKERFFYYFEEDKLIYEHPVPVCFEMNEADKIRNVEDFLTDIEYNYCDVFNIYNIMDFLEKNKKEVYNNILKEDYTFIDVDSKEEITIKKGIKINKALKFFFTPDEKEELTNLQMAMSRLIQKDKVKGTLCMSIHPLDYLSLSENTHNWRSCHALDGEYRTGNLSYMLDSSTIICYLKSDGKYELPHFPPTVKWNSKKWRMLIHISNDENLVFAGRQYPFSSERGLDLVRTELMGKRITKSWTDWSNDQINSFKTIKGDDIKLCENYIVIDGYLKAIGDIVKQTKGAKNFNDVLFSNYYTPYYSYRGAFWMVNNKTEINIGATVPCLCCEKDDVCETDLFRCIKCEEKYGVEDNQFFDTCQICGDRRHRSALRSTTTRGYICLNCIDEHDYPQCQDCFRYIIDKNDMVIDEDNRVLCQNCYEWRND